jgi:hypothetical protein
VQTCENGAADVAVRSSPGSLMFCAGDEEVLGGFDGDLPADPVWVRIGHGLDGVGDRGAQRLVQGQQRHISWLRSPGPASTGLGHTRTSWLIERMGALTSLCEARQH